MGSQPKEADFILAIETSSAYGSVCLGRGGEVLESRVFSGARRHAVEFLPTIDDLARSFDVRPSQLAGVAVSVGPGSFTGLRIGVTAARAFSLALGSRLVAVPTLEVIAQNAGLAPTPPLHAGVMLDAKRGHVYAATFCRTESSYVTDTEPREWNPREFLESLPADAAVLGEGIAYHRDPVDESNVRVLPEELWPARAETLYRLAYERFQRGDVVGRRDLIPLYIRPPEAEEKWLLRHGSDG